jgi:hypothetical protein
MATEIHWLRDKAGETEKITINLGYGDLGHIDLLVQEGFYSYRMDFIRTAIRSHVSDRSRNPFSDQPLRGARGFLPLVPPNPNVPR